MMYIKFILLFTIAHAVSYTLAGAIILKFSREIYENKERLCDYQKDMADEKERKYVEKHFFPAQILRGLLMGVVLLPILSALEDLTIIIQFIFFVSLMFIYTHISSAAPAPDNIEGQVHFKNKYLQKNSFIKFQVEMVMYSVLFGLIKTFFMHFFI